jgi:hypothetical protein
MQMEASDAVWPLGAVMASADAKEVAVAAEDEDDDGSDMKEREAAAPASWELSLKSARVPGAAACGRTSSAATTLRLSKAEAQRKLKLRNIMSKLMNNLHRGTRSDMNKKAQWTERYWRPRRDSE